MKPEKTTCPVSAAEFNDKAVPCTIKIGDQTITGEVKVFSSGSFGWYCNGKISLPVGDRTVSVQVGANLVIVGSKDAPREAPKAEAKKK